MNTKHIISSTCKRRLITQGFTNLTDEELRVHKFGIRLAYGTCASIVIFGLITGNIYFLAAAGIIAIFGTILPRHPVDYIYNSAIRHILNKPKLPPRSNQSRFACGIATTLLATIIYLFYKEYMLAGYLVGAILLTSAFLVTFFDICIPSMIYNALFLKKPEESPAIE